MINNKDREVLIREAAQRFRKNIRGGFEIIHALDIYTKEVTKIVEHALSDKWISVERFMDEIDADDAGMEWLSAYIDDSDKLTNVVHDGEGGKTVTMWKSNKPVAMYTVLRDELNWSVLIMQPLPSPPQE